MTSKTSIKSCIALVLALGTVDGDLHDERRRKAVPRTKPAGRERVSRNAAS